MCIIGARLELAFRPKAWRKEGANYFLVGLDEAMCRSMLADQLKAIMDNL